MHVRFMSSFFKVIKIKATLCNFRIIFDGTVSSNRENGVSVSATLRPYHYVSALIVSNFSESEGSQPYIHVYFDIQQVFKTEHFDVAMNFVCL